MRTPNGEPVPPMSKAEFEVIRAAFGLEVIGSAKLRDITKEFNRELERIDNNTG